MLAIAAELVIIGLQVLPFSPAALKPASWVIVVVWIVLGILISLAIGGMITALVAGAMGSAGYYGYDYHGSW